MIKETLSAMKLSGFTGSDACLKTSLVEYGLAWQERETDWLFYYACPRQEKRFQWGRVAKDTDAFKEWNWALQGDKLTGFLSCSGETLENFQELPLIAQVEALVQYYGPLEIFGEAYSEGFEITCLEWN
jgi:hypothetical protein